MDTSKSKNTREIVVVSIVRFPIVLVDSIVGMYSYVSFFILFLVISEIFYLFEFKGDPNQLITLCIQGDKKLARKSTLHYQGICFGLVCFSFLQAR